MASVLLIRHAEREPFPDGEPGDHVSITPEGAANARHLGELLKGRAPFWTEVSPVPRCGQTARALLEGAALTGDPATHPLLGAPGAFITDAALAWQVYVEHRTEAVVRALLEGKSWPGMRDLETGSRLLLAHVREKLDVCGGRGVLVSHDSILNNPT